MSTITFSNGKKVTFNGTPTQKDVEEVAAKLGLNSPAAAPQQVTPKTIIQKLSAKAVPGAESAVIPAKAADGGLGLGDIAKAIPNALGDVWNLVKEATYGTAKKVVYDIPKEGYNLFKDQRVGDAIKNLAKAVPRAVFDTASSLVPQSLKEVGGTNVLEEIPSEFRSLVKENGGSYANALLAAVKALPGGIPDAIQIYANQIDRSRQALENHPVNEFLGYLGLKSLATSKIKPGESTPIVKQPSAKTGSFKPEINELFKNEGIKPPLSAITDSSAVRGMEAVASKGLFGGKIRDIATKAIEDVQKRTNQIIDRIKPEKGLSDEAIGKELQRGLEDFKNNRKLVEGKIYDEFSKTYGESNVFGMKTKDAVQTILDEPGQGYFENIDSRLQRLLNKITGANNPEVKALQDQVNQFKSAKGGKVPPEIERALEAKKAEVNKDLTFTELKSIRTQVGEALTKEPTNTELKRLYGALTEDMQSAVAKIAEQDPLLDNPAKAARDALDRLNEGYSSGANKLQSDIALSIEKSQPESIAQNFIKRNSADSVKLMKEIVGPQKFKLVQEYFMRDIFENSITRDKFDVGKFEKKLGEYDKATLKEMLSDEQLKSLEEAKVELRKFDKMAESLKSGAKMAEGSQTAFLTKISAFTGSLFSGQFLIAAGIFFGDLALKSLFTTDFGRKLLTEGLTPSNLKAVKDYKNLPEKSKQIIMQSFKQEPDNNK